MPPRLFERLSAAFWGYLSPRQPATKKRSTPVHHVRPSRVTPTNFVTPERPGSGYLPLTPADTHAGSKRKRDLEVEDHRKRTRHDDLEDDDYYDDIEEVRLEDEKLEKMAGSKELYEPEDIDNLYSEDDEYDSGDEDDEEGARYDYDVYNHTLNPPRLPDQGLEGSVDEDDGIKYDYNIYNPTIRSNIPLPGQKALLESALPRDVPQIIINSTEDESDEDVINVIPKDAPSVYADGDEDFIVFNDTDADDNSALDVDTSPHANSSFLAASQNEPSLFGSFLEEAQDGEDTILLDSRARVGSLEDERVSKDQLLARGWPQNTVWLIQRIHNRGREPVFAFHWHLDFPMMPEGMFLPAYHDHPGYINTLRNKDFRAKHAFERLMQLGPKVRDKITVGLAPEKLIVDEVQRYMAWSDWDSSNQFPSYPFIEIHTGTRDEDVNALQDALLLRLSNLHKHWLAPSDKAPKRPAPFIRPADDDLDQPPPLYGILVSHTLLGIVAFVPGAEDSDSIGYLRTVGVFDFNVVGYDVWTSLALALLVIHVRDEGVKRGCSRRRDGMKNRWARGGASMDPDR
ncbi:hypothetical protein KCU81_g5493, partial [Aureobasidium melanogenum]|uniref:Uncharacterized protein n=1 Tax=Aureobasidium melanogenum (strain CBS 110374) TaxID=1043003 RepID=A0A074VXQ4_AURM1